MMATWEECNSVTMLLIDFDGTVVHHAFPNVGEPLPGALECLRDLLAAGYVLILFTCREDHPERPYLTEAIEFCRGHGIEFAGVNETPPQYDYRGAQEKRRKPYAHVHIDDRNLGGFPGWDVVRQMLLTQET
jgi:trehalose-6-phosphatase